MTISASDIAIVAAGSDITNHVLYSTARFEGQLGAVPGTAEMTVKDPDQVYDFVTGDEITLDIDGVRMWGGYIVTADQIFAFPAVDTSTPANVKVRQWKLTCIDYNVLFDKRVLRNTSNYLSHLPFFTLDKTMGELVRDVLPGYLDVSGDGIDFDTFVDDTFVPRFDASGNPDPDATKNGSWPQQGSYWRAAMDQFAQFGVIYYIDPSKRLHLHEVEDTAAPWGFSDVPNKLPLPNASATYGMREFERTKDATAMANDAFVWGGSEFAGSKGGTVFARSSNAGSITDHGRWQYAETRFGDLRSQGEVKARANVIVSGNTTGASGGDTARGLAVEQFQARLAWFGHDVPLLSGSRSHLMPGMVVTMTMYVLGVSPDPLVLILPLRTVKISFPTLPATGSSPSSPKTYVRFDGFFGVQLSDPYWLWRFLRQLRSSTQVTPLPVSTADNDSTSVVYGAYYADVPSPAPDGSTTVFTIPFAYIDQTSTVYKNGLALLRGVEYTESSPEDGQLTIPGPLVAGTKLYVTCRIAGGL
jgi:hypothetical protein